jgi:pyruvate/2-oxoglutarate dehydrogenase complex dihydrolipoamide dehydrogenase (E3) component
LRTEDEDVSEAVAAAFKSAGVVVRENFGSIERFEKTSNGVRMVFTEEGKSDSAEAAVVVVTVGWVADAAGLNLAKAGVELDGRGFVQTDEYLRTLRLISSRQETLRAVSCLCRRRYKTDSSLLRTRCWGQKRLALIL